MISEKIITIMAYLEAFLLIYFLIEYMEMKEKFNNVSLLKFYKNYLPK